MKRNWSKKLLAGVLSLAMVFTAAFAVSPNALRASASQAAERDPYVPQQLMIAGQNLGIKGNENRLMHWDYNQNTTAYLNTFTGNLINEFRIAGTPFALTFNSLDTEKKFFGIGVSSIFDQSIKKLHENAYEFTEADGGKRYFTLANKWQDGYGNSLAFTGKGYVVNSEKRSLTFDESGKLLHLEQSFAKLQNPLTADFVYDANGVLTDVRTSEFGSIHLTPTKQGDNIDAKDIEFERMPEGYGQRFIWYYSGIMDFGEIDNTDGTYVMTSCSGGLGQLYDYNHTKEFTPVVNYDAPRRIPLSIRHRDNAVNLDATWEFTYGDHMTKITLPNGAQTITHFDIWGNPIGEPEQIPVVPAEQVAQGVNLGNHLNNLLKSWNPASGLTASVNGYNGNIVCKIDITSYFSLTYNSQGNQQTEFGSGFSSPANRMIEKISDNVYLMTDEDGCLHYFMQELGGPPYTFRDDRGITLYVRDTYYALEGGLQYRKSFDKANGRESINTYNEDGTAATAPYGISFAYYAATADRGPRVQSISENGVIKATFGYNAQGNISAIIFADGNSVLFTYDSTGSVITGIQNIADGSRLLFGYSVDEDGLQRARNIRLFDAPDSMVDLALLEYNRLSNGNRQTTVTDMQGTKTTYTFNKRGDKI